MFGFSIHVLGYSRSAILVFTSLETVSSLETNSCLGLDSISNLPNAILKSKVHEYVTF